MQAFIETLFDAVYLVSVITIGILMIRESKGNKQFCLFGLMAVVLGAGDSFHLIPRALALCTTGLENYTVPLGLGKWITSVTMTIFYVLLYYVWRQRYQIKGKGILTAAVYTLAAARMVWSADSRGAADCRRFEQRRASAGVSLCAASGKRELYPRRTVYAGDDLGRRMDDGGCGDDF